MRFVFAASFSVVVTATFSVPNVPLKNAAKPGVVMPAVGLGTFGYSTVPVNGDCRTYPECWNELSGCGSVVTNVTSVFLELATSSSSPIRIDSADDYFDMTAVGSSIASSGIPRNNIFVTSKIGNAFAMGYNETWSQIHTILSDLKLTYVDALLIHWPTSSTPSSEPACKVQTPTYNATTCRLITWKAMTDIYNAGLARSIGVSNYNVSQLEEFVAAGVLLPAINQIPIHIYRSSSQSDTISWCNSHNVVVNSYSPLGVPDWHSFSTSTGMSANALQDPVLTQIASAHGRSPAAVVIAWLWSQGIVTNPRTMVTAHMVQNLGAYDLTLTAAEIKSLSSRPQDFCSIDPNMYECAP